jgi:uncharacterized membrane protein YraQ (UPF0718 family)
MEFILELAIKSMEQVGLSWLHNWPYLLVSVVIATALKLYVHADKVAAFLGRYRGAGVVAATAVAVATPLCSCGTTAVVLGMMASRTAWAPIVAFMVASPLTSPEGLVYSAGLFGWPFALAFYLASILLGLGGGWVTAALERRGWLANQARYTEPGAAPCACPAPQEAARPPRRLFGLRMPGLNLRAPGMAPIRAEVAFAAPAASCGCGQVEFVPGCAEPGSGCSGDVSGPAQSSSPAAPAKPGVTLAAFVKEFYRTSKYLVVMFTGFAFVGYFLNGLIPASWVAAVFGGGNAYSVPLAATLGLPFYINAEASLPLVRALLDAGMSPGAALAFLIAGSGTSLGAIAGALTIARWRVVALVVGILWAGAILCGIAFNLVLMLRLF